MTDTEQLVQIFKADKRFSRIMDRLREKYQSYGEHKGNVTLKDATADECEALNCFILPKKYFKAPAVTFSVKAFEEAIYHTPYPHTTLKSVLESYYQEKIYTSSEKNSLEQKKLQEFFGRMKEKFRTDCCAEWLCHMSDTKKNGYPIFISEYKADNSNAEILLDNICQAINSRYADDFEPIQLAVLSAEITGNSHYFDFENSQGKLLLYAIAFYREKADFRTVEDRLWLYNSFGIETNNISGTVAVFGIRFFDDGGKEQTYLNGFADAKEPLLLCDRNMKSIIRCQSKNHIVYAVENPSVFSILADYFSETATDCGIICTFGQIKAVGMKLIGKLIENDCTIHYAGDFDPEGLQIADKLIAKFPKGKVIAWRMAVTDYIRIKKNTDILNTRRLSLLDKITDESLCETAVLIKKEKVSAYQELLVETMIEDIRKCSSSLFI